MTAGAQLPIGRRARTGRSHQGRRGDMWVEDYWSGKGERWLMSDEEI